MTKRKENHEFSSAQRMRAITMSLSLSAPATVGVRASRRRHHRRTSSLKCAAAAASSSAAPTTSTKPALTPENLKSKILRLSALTDRGQLLFQQAAYAPLDKYNAAHKAEFLECVVGLYKLNSVHQS
jgi:hypothetical protein